MKQAAPAAGAGVLAFHVMFEPIAPSRHAAVPFARASIRAWGPNRAEGDDSCRVWG